MESIGKAVISALSEDSFAAAKDMVVMIERLLDANSSTGAVKGLLEDNMQQKSSREEFQFDYNAAATLIEQLETLVPRMQSGLADLLQQDANDTSRRVSLTVSLLLSICQMCRRLFELSKSLQGNGSEPCTSKAEDGNQVLAVNKNKLELIQASNEKRLAPAAKCVNTTTAVFCEDVAFTAQGTLLVAAGDRGLIEYDQSGKTIGSWSAREYQFERCDPGHTGPDCAEVETVDVLEDGRVVVGLFATSFIWILRRSDTRSKPGRSWKIDHKLNLSRKETLAHISVHNDLVVVVGNHKTVVLSDLALGQEQLRFRPGYFVSSVAVTSDSIIAASKERVKVSSGEQRYLVASYGHHGQSRWKREWNEPIEDICTAPNGLVLYLALPESHRVRAITAEDGKEVGDIFSYHDHEVVCPWRISVSKGQNTSMAVLQSCGSAVNIHELEA